MACQDMHPARAHVVGLCTRAPIVRLCTQRWLAPLLSDSAPGPLSSDSSIHTAFQAASFLQVCVCKSKALQASLMTPRLAMQSSAHAHKSVTQPPALCGPTQKAAEGLRARCGPTCQPTPPMPLFLLCPHSPLVPLYQRRECRVLRSCVHACHPLEPRQGLKASKPSEPSLKLACIGVEA